MKDTKTFFTSDLHLGHKNVIDFCKRPFKDVVEMDKRLIDGWNAVVRPQDEIYVLGDVCFHKASIGVPMMQELQGQKYLVRGNHDKYSFSQYHDAGFQVVCEEVKLRVLGQYLKLSHFPYGPTLEGQKGMDPHDLRYMDRRPADQGNFLLCGHVHDKWKTQGRMINVGVDVWDYRPVSGEEIVKLVMDADLRSELVPSEE